MTDSNKLQPLPAPPQTTTSSIPAILHPLPAPSVSNTIEITNEYPPSNTSVFDDETDDTVDNNAMEQLTMKLEPSSSKEEKDKADLYFYDCCCCDLPYPSMICCRCKEETKCCCRCNRKPEEYELAFTDKTKETTTTTKKEKVHRPMMICCGRKNGCWIVWANETSKKTMIWLPIMFSLIIFIIFVAILSASMRKRQ